MKLKIISGIEYNGMAAVLKPSLYFDGKIYTAELTKGNSFVKGSGETSKLAMEDWESNLRNHLSHCKPLDDIVQLLF